MELNFTLLVIAALAGMVAKLIVGWDPWKLLGSLTLTFTMLLLLPPLLGLAFENDPQVVQETTSTLIERVIAEIPSILVGEVAGVFAATILSFTRSLFKGW